MSRLSPCRVGGPPQDGNHDNCYRVLYPMFKFSLPQLNSNILVPSHVNKAFIRAWISAQERITGPVLQPHHDSCRQPSPCVDAPADSSAWWRWSTAGYHGDRRCEEACLHCRPPAWGRSRTPGDAHTRPPGSLLLLSGAESRTERRFYYFFYSSCDDRHIASIFIIAAAWWKG